MNFQKLAASLTIAIGLAVPGYSLTIQITDNNQAGSVLLIEDDGPLDIGDPNAYLGRQYHSRIITAPFSFGGFDFSRLIGQGDGYSWIGDNESAHIDSWRDRIGTQLELAGSGSITIAISDRMQNRIDLPFFNRAYNELENFVAHVKSPNTELNVSVSSFRGLAAFDMSELLLASESSDFRSMPGGTSSLFDRVLFSDRPLDDYSDYWSTQVVTLSGSGFASVRTVHAASISNVPLPASGLSLTGTLAMMGFVFSRKSGKSRRTRVRK